MILFLLLSALLVLPGIKIAPIGRFQENYVSKNQTSAINGLFTLLIFWSHVSTYIKLDGSLDAPYSTFKSYMLQLVVVPFFFYSGYGIMESIKERGTDYVKSIPSNRFLKVLLHFDLAVLLYIVINFSFGKSLNAKQMLLAFTGYNSIGNSNWYIFDILVLYLIVFAAFMLARKKLFAGAIITTVLTVGFVFAQMLLKRNDWCYNTVILFPVGMIFSLVKPQLEKLITKHDALYLSATAVAFAAYSFFYLKRAQGIEFYSMWAILFMALIVLVTMKIRIGNKVLSFFGSHVFSIYILQRLPMIFFSSMGLAARNKYVFVVVCFIATVILAVLFDKFTEGFDNVLLSKRIKKSA